MQYLSRMILVVFILLTCILSEANARLKIQYVDGSICPAFSIKIFPMDPRDILF